MDDGLSRSPHYTTKTAVLGFASAVISALWIAVCAASPEFIWQGLRIAFGHPNLADLLSALFIGVTLAFFVEPLTERVRDFLPSQKRSSTGKSKPADTFFTIGLSLAFALTSVCLHDAMSAFVSGRNGAPGDSQSGLTAALAITIGWAIVPFAVALAWLAMRSRWLAIPAAIVAVASSFVAGWLFSWSTQSIITTLIPSVIILALGYRRLARNPRAKLSRCAGVVVVVGAGWLACALLADALLALFHLRQFRLYTFSGYWTDARFYLGWSLGLILAPSPRYRGEPREEVVR